MSHPTQFSSQYQRTSQNCSYLNLLWEVNEPILECNI